MISILIPNYNYDCTPLLENLIRQQNINSECEIIVYDDASTEEKILKKNKSFCAENNIQFIENPQNKGRSIARNQLAQLASHNWLLFLDSDVLPVKNNFINFYLSSIQNTNYDVFTANIVYDRNFQEKKKNLRWKYGVKYEEHFKENNFGEIKSANFCIKKEILLKFPFQEMPHNYGFEDVLWGIELKENNVAVQWINNPIYHLGLESNLNFVHKTELAMKNIHDLVGKKNVLFLNEIKIAKTFCWLRKYHLVSILNFLFSFSKNKLLKNLTSDNPSVIFLQLYKLGYLCSLEARR